MQLFVRCLDSRSRACDVEPCCSVADLKCRIQETEGVPSGFQGLVYGGRQLEDARSLQSYGIEAHSTLTLVLRLRGGKGGFGALLRGLGRDGSKTTNDDAMRDLQGRRMRHSNAEQKLKEWEAKAKERELEKLALQHIKQVERQARREHEQKVEVESIAAAQKAAVAGVQNAVQSALAEGKIGGDGNAVTVARRNGVGPALPGKRAAAGSAAAAPVGPAVKRSRMLAAVESYGNADSESTSDDDDE